VTQTARSALRGYDLSAIFRLVLLWVAYPPLIGLKMTALRFVRSVSTSALGTVLIVVSDKFMRFGNLSEPLRGWSLGRS
jgi:hypothetical protein